jgi:hypothetical protein
MIKDVVGPRVKSSSYHVSETLSILCQFGIIVNAVTAKYALRRQDINRNAAHGKSANLSVSENKLPD